MFVAAENSGNDKCNESLASASGAMAVGATNNQDRRLHSPIMELVLESMVQAKTSYLLGPVDLPRLYLEQAWHALISRA